MVPETHCIFYINVSEQSEFKDVFYHFDLVFIVKYIIDTLLVLYFVIQFILNLQKLYTIF